MARLAIARAIAIPRHLHAQRDADSQGRAIPQAISRGATLPALLRRSLPALRAGGGPGPPGRPPPLAALAAVGVRPVAGRWRGARLADRILPRLAARPLPATALFFARPLRARSKKIARLLFAPGYFSPPPMGGRVRDTPPEAGDAL